jgi:hypothetical protein
MTLSLVVSSEADAQIEVIDSWWRANRPAAPDLFSQELRKLSRAFALPQRPAIVTRIVIARAFVEHLFVPRDTTFTTSHRTTE